MSKIRKTRRLFYKPAFYQVEYIWVIGHAWKRSCFVYSLFIFGFEKGSFTLTVRIKCQDSLVQLLCQWNRVPRRQNTLSLAKCKSIGAFTQELAVGIGRVRYALGCSSIILILQYSYLAFENGHLWEKLPTHALLRQTKLQGMHAVRQECSGCRHRLG